MVGQVSVIAATISFVLLYTEGHRVHEVVALENYAYRPVL